MDIAAQVAGAHPRGSVRTGEGRSARGPVGIEAGERLLRRLAVWRAADYCCRMTTMGSDPAAEVSAELFRVRQELMGGRGPGAGDAEVAAHTRDRVMIGGQTATRRLEIAARQTGYARRDPAAISRTTRLTGAELAQTVAQLADRLHPRRLLSVGRESVRRRLGARPVAFVLLCLALVLAVRHRRHSSIAASSPID
jgi:hypothetical protein